MKDKYSQRTRNLIKIAILQLSVYAVSIYGTNFNDFFWILVIMSALFIGANARELQLILNRRLKL